MRRILLVIDDFNELVGLETLFRRLGFDVLSLGREALVADAILGFPPDLVIATGRGRNVDGLKLAAKLRSGVIHPRLVVLLPLGKDGDFGSDPGLARADVDAVIETPFDPQAALKVVSRLLAIPVEPLLEKLSKIMTARLFESDELKIIKHQDPSAANTKVNERGASHSAETVSRREQRFAKFLKEELKGGLPPILNPDTMREARTKIAETEKNASIEDEQSRAKLQREKREFVRAMLETAATRDAGEVEKSLKQTSNPTLNPISSGKSKKGVNER